MKHLFVTFILLSIYKISFSQTNYSTGFSQGYKNGYCYGKIGCVVPIVPVSPLPKIGESSDSFIDGYNTGILSGRNAADQEALTKNQNSSTIAFPVAPQIPEMPLFKPDFKFYQQMLTQLEQSSSTNQSNMPILSEEDRQVLAELNNPNKIKENTEYIKFLETFFSSQSKLPSYFPDGSYDAVRICKPHSVDSVTVVIKDGHLSFVYSINPFSKKYEYTADANDHPDYRDHDIAQVIRDPAKVINGKIVYGFEVYFKEKNTFYKPDITYEVYLLDYVSSYISMYQQAQRKIREVIKEYNSMTRFRKIPDGWSICYATDGDMFCDVRSVYVESGKITKYRSSDNTEHPITSGGTILNDRANISYYYKNLSISGGLTLDVLEVYFL